MDTWEISGYKTRAEAIIDAIQMLTQNNVMGVRIELDRNTNKWYIEKTVVDDATLAEWEEKNLT